MVGEGWEGHGGWGVKAKKHRVSLWDDEKVIKSFVAMIPQRGECTENQRVVRFGKDGSRA